MSKHVAELARVLKKSPGTPRDSSERSEMAPALMVMKLYGNFWQLQTRAQNRSCGAAINEAQKNNDGNGSNTVATIGNINPTGLYPRHHLSISGTYCLNRTAY
ncbi:uncharacterized protein LOC129753127 [Uranotaenia lowii]|uniref:uncharacterized protein LOC129753127 n=1 Tax=Uranotaenia lowii TaxID=190385 RepID=UPI002479754B|nr:uncharacterized protein LOC129753127 [Uranotaenia lowii]